MTDQTDFEPAHYTGQTGPLFRLAMLTNVLTVLTLGIYRFWAKTRVRRYIWSATRFQGDGFEYTGTGLEKFLGFLIAIVFLAGYLGVVNLLLFFAGIRFVLEPTTESELIMQSVVITVSFLALLPWIWFATYRSRRYMLARTRFRGIRFGMESAAWGYVWRAAVYQVLTVVSLGLLLPRQTYALSKYMTDRSWYGDARFLQSGRWTALYGAMTHVFIGVGILTVSIVIAAVTAESTVGPPVAFIVLFMVGYVWLLIGLVCYRVRSFAYLMSNTTLEGAIAFRATPSVKTVVTKMVIGGILLGVVVTIVLAIFGVVFAGVMAAATKGVAVGTGTIVAGVLAYLLILAGIGAGALVLITQPIIAHVVGSTAVANAEALAHVEQRAFDKGADAEGFADALDIGGAI